MNENSTAQLPLRLFSNATQRDDRHVICAMRFFVSGKLGAMISDVSSTIGRWCRLETDEPIEIGKVLSARIVGVRSTCDFDNSGEELPATGARGREIVAWRGIDGVLQLSEARCPHQFVHLASSGTVDGCELVCTAHFWRFAATGEGSIRESSGHREPVSALTVFLSFESDRKIWGFLPSPFWALET